MSKILTLISEEIAKALLQINAIKLSPQNPFIWASGIKSPIYCDNRLVLSYPKIRNLIIRGFVQLSNSLDDFNKIAGVATAGIAHGALLAHALELPFVYVRSKAKEHGRQNLIEGYADTKDRYLVIEDLFSTGGSAKLAVNALNNGPGKVVAVASIFSYGFDKIGVLENEMNLPFISLTNYDILIREALKLSYISAEHFETLQAWRVHPEKWGAS